MMLFCFATVDVVAQGSVGIGTSAPNDSVKLDVAGSVYVEGKLGVGLLPDTTSSAADMQIGTGLNIASLPFGLDSTNRSFMVRDGSTGTVEQVPFSILLNLLVSAANSSIGFWGSAGSAITPLNNAWVGIGTSSPIEVLGVDGAIAFGEAQDYSLFADQGQVSMIPSAKDSMLAGNQIFRLGAVGPDAFAANKAVDMVYLSGEQLLTSYDGADVGAVFSEEQGGVYASGINIANELDSAAYVALVGGNIGDQQTNVVMKQVSALGWAAFWNADYVFGSQAVCNECFDDSDTITRSVAMGSAAFYNASGDGLIGIGYEAGGTRANGMLVYQADNIVIGRQALNELTSFMGRSGAANISQNVVIGSEAGQGNNVGAGNVMLGYGAGPLTPGANSSITIGRNARAAGDFAIALGEGGVAAPNQLFVNSVDSVNISDFWRLSNTEGVVNVTGKTTARLITPVPVYVDGSGNDRLDLTTFTAPYISVNGSVVSVDPILNVTEEYVIVTREVNGGNMTKSRYDLFFYPLVGWILAGPY